MDQKIKFIVFLKMMKKIAYKTYAASGIHKNPHRWS